MAIELPAEEIAKLLTQAGLEVESIRKSAAPFQGVVIAKVIEAQPHPNADRLRVATVSTGSETVQVVCGAANCRAGLVTALATVGATLPDKEGTFKVKKASVRGVESHGMLCAAAELSLGDEAGGIIELPEESPLGADFAAGYEDELFDISLTPNLNHCANLLGLLRELSAATGLPYKIPEAPISATSSQEVQELIKIELLKADSCPRYACRAIQGVKVGPSPHWLKDRLEKCGLRSVNNIVDATNYVLLELGHPLHAFDLDRLSGQKVQVRQAKQGERLTTLDGKERELTEEILLICDAEKPVAIAGIMGGANSEVTERTTNILIESAYFSPSSIRRASKLLGLSSEASKRFERGADPLALLTALERVTSLILLLAGGEAAKGICEEKTQEFSPRTVTCRLAKINALIGHHFGVHEVEGLFKRLGFVYSWDGREAFQVAIPSYRNDLSLEADLIEEVARLYGYHNIEKKSPHYQQSTLPHSPIYLLENEVRARCIAEGLQEFLTCDLIGPKWLQIVQDSSYDQKAEVRVVNPTSIEQSILRQSFLPGLLHSTKINYDQGNPDIAAFEVGRIHFRQGEQYKEQSLVALLLTGLRSPYHHDPKPGPFTFFDLKGYLENLLEGLRVKSYRFERSDLNIFHPHRQAAILIDERKVGTFGELHPLVQKRVDIPQRIYFAELNLHDLYSVRLPAAQMAPLSLYPASDRDWTITLPNQLEVGQIAVVISLAAFSICLN